jgi:hypothetical protein
MGYTTIELLIKHGADVAATGQYSSCYKYAAKYASSETLVLLIKLIKDPAKLAIFKKLQPDDISIFNRMDELKK